MRVICSVNDCDEYVVGQGLCRKHYMRRWRTGSVDLAPRPVALCDVEGCDRPHAAHGKCQTHYVAERRRAGLDKGQPYSANPERGRAHSKTFRATPQGKLVRHHQKLAAYGLTAADYESMLAEQGGVCACCGQPETARHRSGTLFQLAVDHDHDTGRVRGLLCAVCNRALGLLGDSADRVRALVGYLERQG